MKITTRFILTLSVFLLILIGMAVSLIYTNHQVERLYQQDEIAHRIERGTDELSYLTGDYLMYGESQQRARWESSFASFSEDVSGLEVEDPELQAIVAHIEEDRARLWAVFEDVAGTLDRYAQLPDARLDPVFTQLSWSRMEVQVLAVAFKASLLSQKLGDQVDRLKQMNLVLMFSLIGIFGLYLLVNYYLIYRWTLRSIAELQTGTQIIGSGNLDFTIPVKRMDEIGELSLAFNKMTASLKEVTASKADLEREIAERQQVESRLQAVMESSPDAIYLKDRDSRLLLANPATFAVIGKPAEAVLGKTDAEYYHDPATGRAIIENDRRIIDSGRMEVVEESISDEKGTRVFLSTKAPYCDPDGRVIGLVGVARDITERKAAEEALRESERRLIGVLESMPDAFVSFDADMRYTYVNANAERLQAARREDLLGKDVRVVYPDAESYKTISQYERVLREQQSVTLTSYHAGFDRWVEVRAFPTPDGVSVFYKDVSAQVKAEQALRESEARFRLALKNAPVSVAAQDRDLRYIWAYNQQSMSPDQIIGHFDHEIFTAEEAAHFTAIKRFVLEEDIEQREQMWLDRPTGRMYLDICWEPIRDQAGQVIGVASATVDLTPIKLAEEVLAETALKLERSNQELEQFAFVASHDLQEPLRKVKIFGSSLQQKLQGRLDEESQDSFQRMLSATGRMQLMIDNLLELARVNTKGRPFVPVDLSNVAAEVVCDLEQRILHTGGQVVVEALPWVEADPIQIHQVLQNLIGNGLKFHKADTPPIVNVSSTIAKSRIGKGEVVSIQVKDNGIGFEEQQFEKILQPFQRLHGRSNYEGIGMGLAIVKKIVERHHGEISAHSTPGEGSTFFITLPAKVNSS
ncbi:MAG: PAS domain S-box protein [Chloroflexi bacterium]|nr:MAG: PAS domain S-box protein [Chloroflexota bacterium]